jgi:hypothetical protein
MNPLVRFSRLVAAISIGAAPFPGLAAISESLKSEVAPASSTQERLAMGPVHQSAAQVRRCELLELTVALEGHYENPFDPAQIALDGHFISPSGQEIVVPGFLYQDYDRQVDGLTETLTPKGGPVWKVRFAPVEEGGYVYRVIAKDRSGTKTSAAGAFECIPSSSHGYLRVSKVDPHYFEFEDGAPYLAIGHNACWYRQGNGTPEYDRWFGEMAKNGENHARLWMPEWAFGLEHGRLGHYRLDRAWQLDYVLRLAEQKGIYIKLCVSAWRNFKKGKVVYDKANGGPCASPPEFFTREAPKRLFKNRLRYIVARWGHSPHIMAWELWNEFNTVAGYKENHRAYLDWTVEMARYLNSIDYWKHMTVQSLGSCNFDDALWHLPEMDWAQMHGYYYFNEAMRRDAKDMAYFIPLWQDKIRAFGKPALFAEFGISKHGKELREKDTEGVNLHNGIWSAIVTGGAGTAMLWWWDNQIHPMNQYWHFKPLAQFTADVPWTTQGFMPDVPAASDGLRCYALEGLSLRLLWIQNRKHTWWNVVHGKPVEPVKGGRVTLDRAGRDVSYTVEWWDTYEGGIVKKERVTPVNGQIVLTVPDLEKDIAAKVIRK